MSEKEKADRSKAIIFRINDHGQGPELLRQVFLEKGWVEFDEENQEEEEWNLWWRTSRFRNCDYENICPWQRLNHYPKSTGITKKDCLARNMKRMKGVHGAGVYNFNPLAFNLPNDYTRFVAEYSRLKQMQDSKPLLWICKPADLSRGRGIFIFRDISELQYDCNAVVQRYITNPLLIGGYKFDIRVYVAVPSFHPLSIYVFEEGLVRFGTEKFDLNALHNVFAHLTNTSINKHSPGYLVDKERVGPGCKWTISQLRQYLHQHNINDGIMWIRIINIIILTMLVQAPQVPKTKNCFELYGFDILIDENLKPWLLEVNFSPALSFDCQVDILVKKPMLHDLLTMMNFKDSDIERGGPKKVSSRIRGNRDDPIDRHSSMSRLSQRGSVLRKSSSFHKNLTNLSKQHQTVDEGVSYLEHEPEIKPDESLCFGLPLVEPANDRQGSASSGVSSANNDQMDMTGENMVEKMSARQKKSEQIPRTFDRSNTETSFQFSDSEPFRVYDHVSNPKGSVIHTSIGPVNTTMERSATMSSVVRRPDQNQGSQALTEKCSINSSSTTDSGISCSYSYVSEGSDMTTDNAQKRGSLKLLPYRQKTNNSVFTTTSVSGNSTYRDDVNSTYRDDVNSTHRDGAKSSYRDNANSTYRDGAKSTYRDGGNSFNISSLKPTENSNALRKIAASATLPSPVQTPLPLRNRSRLLNGGDGSISLRKNGMYRNLSKSPARYTTPVRGTPGIYAGASNLSESRLAKTQLIVSNSPVPRKSSRYGNEKDNSSNALRRPPLNPRQNINRNKQTSQGSKRKGPPPKVGMFSLVFPLSDVTLRTANNSLDPHTVIKETQRLLKASLHSVDKNDTDYKQGGFLPYGAEMDSERLWGPIKAFPAEDS